MAKQIGSVKLLKAFTREIATSLMSFRNLLSTRALPLSQKETLY